MSEVQQRLAKCFSAAFPGLNAAAIHSASPATVPAWDSVATVTLIALIEEEFGVAIDSDEVDTDISFSKLQTLLERRNERSGFPVTP